MRCSALEEGSLVHDLRQTHILRAIHIAHWVRRKQYWNKTGSLVRFPLRTSIFHIVLVPWRLQPLTHWWWDPFALVRVVWWKKTAFLTMKYKSRLFFFFQNRHSIVKRSCCEGEGEGGRVRFYFFFPCETSASNPSIPLSGQRYTHTHRHTKRCVPLGLI